jgi:hypothetical protein
MIPCCLSILNSSECREGIKALFPFIDRADRCYFDIFQAAQFFVPVLTKLSGIRDYVRSWTFSPNRLDL